MAKKKGTPANSAAAIECETIPLVYLGRDTSKLRASVEMLRIALHSHKDDGTESAFGMCPKTILDAVEAISDQAESVDDAVCALQSSAHAGEAATPVI